MDALGLQLTRIGARAVLVDERGVMIHSAVVESPDVFDAAADGVRRVRGDRQPQHLGVAIDPLEGIDISSAGAKLSGLGDVRTVRAGAAAVMAEVWAGAAKGASNAVALWIGETILAGICLEGKPWAGSRGLAGSAAWFALNPVERQDYRKLGSLAAEVSSAGIAHRLAWRVQAGDESAVLQRAGDLESITAAHVFDGARNRDGVSISVVREVARYIGMAVANLATTLDPEVVVIGGPITAAGDLLLDPVRQECSRRLPPPLADQLRCEMSPLGEYGVAVGAARLAADGSQSG
jgi:predicted NBD/HSP70 family sugar kinase